MPFFDQYPYTNFHNVNLDWILERVKEWGQMVKDNNTRFENLEKANEDFKQYVTTYLENLDVQTAIDDKIDRMFESGELTDYLQPHVSSTVTTWLDQHITEPEGVVIDSSLTVSGAAADAKAVGDRLRDPFSDAFKDALLNCFERVAWIDGHGQDYYNALQNSLYNDDYWDYSWYATSGVAPIDINGISAVGSFVDGLFKLGVLQNQEFNYVNSANAEIELVFACVRKSDGEQFPMFSFCHTFENNKGSGFKIFNNISGHISISISGVTIDTGTNFPTGNNLYTMHVIVTSSGCTCSFANSNYSGNGVIDNSYLLGTSIGYPINSENDLRLKSIKYKYL